MESPFFFLEVPLQLLEAINLILPKLGEHRVTRVDIKHPTIAIIVPEIENTLKALLLKGWWFNEFKYTGIPDSEGYITLGSDAITFTPLVSEPFATLRNGKLYNPENLDYTWDAPVTGIVKQLIPFDEIPESAQQFVLYSACVDAFATDIGASQELSIWSGHATTAYSDLLAEHIRQRKYSTRQSGRFSRLRRAMRS